MKTIEKLQLNSLRVCNISKLYGILALCSVLTGNRFNCERYLLSCKQFLNYVLEKEDTDEIGSISMITRNVMMTCFYTISRRHYWM